MSAYGMRFHCWTCGNASTDHVEQQCQVSWGCTRLVLTVCCTTSFFCVVTVPLLLIATSWYGLVRGATILGIKPGLFNDTCPPVLCWCGDLPAKGCSRQVLQNLGLGLLQKFDIDMPSRLGTGSCVPNLLFCRCTSSSKCRWCCFAGQQGSKMTPWTKGSTGSQKW